jgi:hypothetical protein
MRLKAGIVEGINSAIERKRRGKHVSAARSKHATIEKLLEVMFAMRSAPRLYNEDELEKLVSWSEVARIPE